MSFLIENATPFKLRVRWGKREQIIDGYKGLSLMHGIDPDQYFLDGGTVGSVSIECEQPTLTRKATINGTDLITIIRPEDRDYWEYSSADWC